MKRSLFVLLSFAALAGCATVPPGPAVDDTAPPPPPIPTAPPISPKAEPPPPAINLTGFPLPYRQGYADGCASATGPQRKDLTRFGADGNYRTGWTDGLSLCGKKK